MKKRKSTPETVNNNEEPIIKATDTPGVGLSTLALTPDVNLSSLVLTPDNYISVEADKVFMSFHQWQGWLECPAKQSAKLAGKYVEPENEAFLLGSYVDKKLLTPENFDAWIKKDSVYVQHFKRGGEPRAFVGQAEAMIKTIQSDPIAMKMIEGDHQWIITGEIAGIPWRGMLDVIKPQAEIFVDLKTCRSCTETIWDSDLFQRSNWYEHYSYWKQLAIYRELIRQKWGKEFLPMLLAISKEEPPDKLALSFEDNYRLSREIEMIIEKTDEVMAWKTGLKAPPRCEKCAYCRGTKQLKIKKAENQGMKDTLRDIGY